MSLAKLKRVVAAAAVATVSLSAVGCGKSDPGPMGPIGGMPAPLPAPMPVPVPIPVPPVPGLPSAGCVPIDQPIPFTGTNIYFDWANIVGGQLPYSAQPVGTLAIGGTATGGPYQRSGTDGVISMSITPISNTSSTPYSGYPTYTFPVPSQYNQNYGQSGGSAQLANVTGYIQLSALVQQDILYRVAYGQIPLNGATQQPSYYYGQPGYYPQIPQQTPQQVCVSGIAINGGHYYNLVYGARVYLYLNGTNHGYVSEF